MATILGLMSPAYSRLLHSSTMPVESFELTHKDNNVPHTLNERRRQALQEIDDAAFSWFHVKVAAVAGAGFLTDA